MFYVHLPSLLFPEDRDDSLVLALHKTLGFRWSTQQTRSVSLQGNGNLVSSEAVGLAEDWWSVALPGGGGFQLGGATQEQTFLSYLGYQLGTDGQALFGYVEWERDSRLA